MIASFTCASCFCWVVEVVLNRTSMEAQYEIMSYSMVDVDVPETVE